MGFACALLLLLLVCASLTVASAQEAGHRLAPTLTSEDLLGRRVIGVPAPGATEIAPSSAIKARAAASTFYLDPAGSFALSLPGGNWRAKAQSAGHLYSHSVFRRVEAEGFASATARVYVFTNRSDLPFNISRLSPGEQPEVAHRLATRFLSSNVALVSVETAAHEAGTGLHIIADQIIARRAVVRAAIDAFEQQGRLFVIVCCAPLEGFERSAPEFDAITKSLASTATRS
jgi:hypothetical protein